MSQEKHSMNTVTIEQLAKEPYLQKNALKILGGLLLIFNLLAAIRIFDGNLLAPKNHAKNTGHTERYIEYVIHEVSQRLDKPFSLSNGTLLYFERNPGMFSAIVELWLRVGISDPRIMLLLPWLLLNLGLFATFFWVKFFFKNNVMALGVISFLIATPHVPYYGLTLHEPPYTFAFQNIAFLLLVLYYERDRRWLYLAGALVFQFLTYQNYWMHHLQTLAVSFAIAYYYEKKFLNRIVFLSLTTVATSGLFTVWNVIIVKGGLIESINYLKELLLWRMANSNTETYKPVQNVISFKELLLYPFWLEKKIYYMFYVPGSLFALWYWGIKKQLPQRVRESKVLLYLAISLGLWYIGMIQHTLIHAFAGKFSYLLWALLMGGFLAALYDIYLENKSLRRMPLKYSLLYLLPIFLIYGVYGFGVHIVWHTLK